MKYYGFIVALLIPMLLWGASGMAQITLSLNSGIHFGTYEFDTSHRGDVEMGTDGNITIVNNTGLSYAGGASPGAVTISAAPQDVVEIRCEGAGRIIVQSNGERLNVRDMELAVDTGVPYGSGIECIGTANRNDPVLLLDLATNTTPTILMAGRLRIFRDRLDSGFHSASNPGGDTLRLRVLFQ